MINLAGVSSATCDETITDELFIAGIESVRNDQPIAGEVSTHITGRLGGITFRRAWYYWVAEGDVPLEIARKMYAQEPYGRRDVRVVGHCDCPAPDDWAEYYDANGKKVIALNPNDAEVVEKLRRGELEPFMANLIRKMLADNICVATKEEQAALSAKAVVTTYHIDSQAGLKVFVDAMRDTA